MCISCEFSSYINLIEQMFDDPRYSFAWDTLEGIYGWVNENHHITENQKTAVKNIYGEE